MKDHTDITYLLDRSGSMASVQSDVCGGFEAFIHEQQKTGDNASFTLVQFDTVSFDRDYTAAPIKNVSPKLKFYPRGGTPLLDALGQIITQTGLRLSAMPEADRPNKVVFVVHTDGQENSSHEYTAQRIREMIEHQRSVYNWKFVFMSSDITAVNDATAFYGFDQNNSVFMDSSNNFVGTRMLGRKMSDYRLSGDTADLAYTAQERAALKNANATLSQDIKSGENVRVR